MNYATDFKWTDAATDRLRALQPTNISYEEIAKVISAEFGQTVSRLSVQGKAYRIGLSRPKSPAKPKEVKPPREVKARPFKPFSNAPISGPAETCKPVAPVAVGERQAAVDAISTDPKTISDSAFGGCRWPLYRTAADGQTLHCCNPRTSPPYCERHGHLAHKINRSPERVAADAKTWASNIQRAGVNTKGHRHFNLPLEPRP